MDSKEDNTSGDLILDGGKGEARRHPKSLLQVRSRTSFDGVTVWAPR